MADPYEWTDNERRQRDDEARRGYSRNEQDARRAAERYSDGLRTERGDWAPGRDRAADYGGSSYNHTRHSGSGDYGAGWYGEDPARRGQDIPGPYGRPSEQRADDPSRYDRYEQDSQGRRRMSEEAQQYGRQVRDAAERGWRRVKEGLHRTFEEDRRPQDARPGWRAGGMFGGDDRSNSLFSHGDGVPGPAPGPHRGKGPIGYSRSDDRIREDINDRLADDGRLDASGIEVRVEQGEATLSGLVFAREDKRRAEDVAERVSGVKHLQNNLRVRAPEPQAQARPGQPPEPKAEAQDRKDPPLSLN